MIENGDTQEQTLLYEDMSSLEKTDDQLFEFLYNGKVNDEMEYIYQEVQRMIKIESVEYEKLNYASESDCQRQNSS